MATIRGGDKFEAALRDIAAKIAKPATLRVGFLENAKYPDGTPVGLVAAIQEFGAPAVGIPPRPYFRNMVAAKSKEWPEAIALTLRASGLDAKVALEKTGHAISGQLRESIINTNTPPLAAATIARKGFAKPLVDTGHMLGSIDFEVKT